MESYLKRLIGLVIGAVIGIELFFINSEIVNSSAKKEINLPQIEIILEEKSKEERKIDKILEDLAMCESGNNPDIINWNDGGSPSFGLYMWKIDSFWRYNQKYKLLPDIEKYEVRNIIMDSEIQKELTIKVLQEKKGWKNWYNCLKNKYGKF